MKSRKLIVSLFSAALCSAGVATQAAADVGDSVETRKTYRSFETANGNKVQVRKRGQSDHEGNARGARHVKVTDPDGNLVARGVDRARKTDNGKVARAKKRTRVDADGNVQQKRARVRKDGQGNVQGQRQARRLNADGQVTHRARGSVRKHNNGTVTRRTVRQRRG